MKTPPPKSEENAMLTSPLNLRDRFVSPSVTIDLLPLFDALLIAFCFLLLSSRFVVAPGVSLQLPSTDDLDYARSVEVMTVKHNDMILFDGEVYDIRSLKQHLKSVSETDLTSINRQVLLLKIGQSVSIQALLEIADVARTAGFASVHIASEPRTQNERRNLDIER